MSELELTEIARPRPIRKLPESLINQIAAGEVVERPASVVKELIENSLDAGASLIEIELEQGGIQKIKIIDNGSGIQKEDLGLALERHATSKISQPKDLEAISTFGFRGEALSSISSVAEVELISRTGLTHSGFRILVSHGRLESEPREVSAPPGTQITVTGLFSKTPARFKFLRSFSTELAHCQKVVKELALGNPHIRFILRHQERTIGSWVTQSRRERFKECLKLTDNPIEISETREEMTLNAFLVSPEQMASRADLYFFINGRPVRNRPFFSAIRTAYLETMGHGKEPVGVVYLDIKRDWVDVNVHPQKWEVRCYNQESIYQWLLTLFRKHFSHPTKTPPPALSTFPQRGLDFSFERKNLCWTPTEKAPAYPFRFLAQTEKAVICEDSSGLIVSSAKRLSQSHFVRLIEDALNLPSLPTELVTPPLLCHLAPQRFKTLEKHLAFLKRFGFDLEKYGEHDFILRTHPNFQSKDFLMPFLEWLSSDLVTDGMLATEKTFTESLAYFYANTENMPLSVLLDELSFHCSEPASSSHSLLTRISYHQLNPQDLL